MQQQGEHTTPKLFIAYSRKDGGHLDRLRTHLKPLERGKKLEIWYDGEIVPGTKWEKEIKEKLAAAHIILLLVSADSLASDYFHNEEMQAALERHRNGDATVIPVILSACSWKLIPELSQLQALPTDGKPVEDWVSKANAYNSIVEGIHKCMAEMKKRDTAPQSTPSKMDGAREEAKVKPEIAVPSNLPAPIQQLLKDMVHVPGGSFMMGCDEKRDGESRDTEKPLHKVTLKPYHIGKYPVTQAQWQAVMGNNPSNFKGKDLPVEQISWDDAKAFAAKLNELTGKNFRLPTEAEWEYAAGGGSESMGYRFAGSNELDEVAWHWVNSGNKSHAVGQRKPNELGLHDMSGNVWEWCEDDWHYSYQDAPDDGSAWIGSPKRTSLRVLRGGSWGNDAFQCQIAHRRSFDLKNLNLGVGFRIAH